MKTKRLLQIFLMLVVLMLPVLLYAQPDPGDDPDAAIPVDGGLTLLFAAVAGYGVKKLKDERKKRSLASAKD